MPDTENLHNYQSENINNQTVIINLLSSCYISFHLASKTKHKETSRDEIGLK